MNYRVTITWRVTATSHDREETVVESLANIGRAVTEDAPSVWDIAYVIVQPTTELPPFDRSPAQPAKQIETAAA